MTLISNLRALWYPNNAALLAQYSDLYLIIEKKISYKLIKIYSYILIPGVRAAREHTLTICPLLNLIILGKTFYIKETGAR